jgi:hypothetical protein
LPDTNGEKWIKTTFALYNKDKDVWLIGNSVFWRVPLPASLTAYYYGQFKSDLESNVIFYWMKH